MEIGVFTRTFSQPTLAEKLDAIAGHGIRVVQFNFACAGLPSLPGAIDPAQAIAIGQAHAERGLRIAAVSSSFNMIHPDADRRRDGLNRLAVIAASCAALGTSTITLCTGSRDSENMWRHHPDNQSETAWRDLVESMRAADLIAARFGLTLGIEPEPANVVSTAKRARCLLDEIGSPRLRIVFDGANLLFGSDPLRSEDVLVEAIALLGRDLVAAHAKDLAGNGETEFVAAGDGRLDYDAYLSVLCRTGFTGPLLLHSLPADDVGRAVRFLQTVLDAMPRETRIA